MCQELSTYAFTSTKSHSSSPAQKRGPVNGILKLHKGEDSANNRNAGRLPRMKRSLSFDTVEIRQHRILLDRPPATAASCDCIPAALTMSWKTMATEVTTVQDYECNRQWKATPRRLTTQERITKLMEAGYKLEHIRRCQQPCKHTTSPHYGHERDGKTSKAETAAKSGTFLSLMKKATKKMVATDSAMKAHTNAAA